MKNLKRIMELLFVMMLIAFISFSQTAQTNSNVQKKDSTVKSSVNAGPNFVDKDNDGVCDNRQNNRNNQVRGKNFVDKNNDGVCDNCRNNHGNCNCCKTKAKNCCGNGNGWRHGPCCGTGNGYRHRHGR